MNEHFYCGALSKDGLPCVRFKDHGDVHMANGKTGTACMWPCTPDEQTKADAWKAKYESEEDAITEGFGFEVLCRECANTGFVHLTSEPFGRGYGTKVEWARCGCAPVESPREYEEREVKQRWDAIVQDSEEYLKSRGYPSTMSEMLGIELGPPPVRGGR